MMSSIMKAGSLSTAQPSLIPGMPRMMLRGMPAKVGDAAPEPLQPVDGALAPALEEAVGETPRRSSRRRWCR
jgi:hypothetical protein